MMVAVTGVSGSGKSSLVHEVIYKALDAVVNKERQAPQGESAETGRKLPLKRMDRAELLTNVVMVDQSPIGRTPRSNPVTYIKAFDIIREIFARTPEAEKRGYEAGHFPSTYPGGRCETCQGEDGDGGNAISGGCRTGLRRVQRDSLQAEDSRHPLPGPEHS